MMDIQLTDTVQAAYALQDYSSTPRIEGVRFVSFRRFVDDGGSFFEMGRLDETGALQSLPDFHVRQVSFSEVVPGAVKAFHLHLKQSDLWFVPPAHRLLVGLYDARQGSPTEARTMRLVLGDGQATGLLIPPGVAHGCGNPWLEPASVIYFADRQFSAGLDTDEGRLPWDFLGADFWKIERG